MQACVHVLLNIHKPAQSVCYLDVCFQGRPFAISLGETFSCSQHSLAASSSLSRTGAS